jgi:hypothetical protein
MNWMMPDHDATRPAECFARLESVFPMGADGLRHTPAACLDCRIKTECLRAAVASDQGLAVHEERLKRAYEAGRLSLFRRWAERKTLQRRRKKGAGRLGLWGRLLRSARSSGSDAG